MFVSAKDVYALLPARGFITVSKVDGRAYAMKVEPYSAMVLAAKGFATGISHKGQIVRLVLTVSMGAAQRLLSPMNVGACKGISKRKQAPGAKHWVERLDRADSGLTASHRRVVSPLDHLHRRYATGRALGPQEQA